MDFTMDFTKDLSAKTHVADTATKTDIKAIRALMSVLGIDEETKQNIVFDLTDQRTTSLRELTKNEAEWLIAVFENQRGAAKHPESAPTVLPPSVAPDAPPATTNRRNNKSPEADKMRRKILHLLGCMGYTTAEGRFDYPRIENFIQNIGANNPERAKLNHLTNEELTNICTQVDQIWKKRLKKR